MRTDHPRQRRAFVPVSGFVRPILAVTPHEARLGDLERARTWYLKLFPTPGAPLGAFEGTVQLRTASPLLPTFGISLSGRSVGD